MSKAKKLPRVIIRSAIFLRLATELEHLDSLGTFYAEFDESDIDNVIAEVQALRDEFSVRGIPFLHHPVSDPNCTIEK